MLIDLNILHDSVMVYCNELLVGLLLFANFIGLGPFEKENSLFN